MKEETNKDISKLAFQRAIAFAGIILFIGKLIAWRLTNSDAVFSDAMESIVNIVSAFLGLYSLYLAAKPKDKEHPYGHGKVEFITSGVEGILIIVAGILIIGQAVNSLINGNHVKDLDWGILIVLITGIINYALGWYSLIKGKRENSLVLIASGKHLQSDTITTLGVVLSLVIVHLTKWYWIDSFVALLFGSYIIFVGYQIVRKALSGIMDESDEKLLKEITAVLLANRRIEWIDIHNMKIQQYGAHLHIDAHITLPWYYSLRDAHAEMEKVIILLAKNLDRQIEFNFHMDDCKPISCSVCQISNCPVREFPFEKKVEWTIKNISQVQKHTV
ncbi:cation diffusion facilitator family transporter [Elizabethkingia meningoseptica]|uniref:Cation diffusion facilitator family transporter n=1 Tax=Elizabethkingia meningoseptica TaxID=238 RepID=A0A1V3TVL4_ELIME|nr:MULTISPECIES: cation diffusion facilitator family transporter [Elizabethkingia]AQX12048.1 cation diffusion facilitator family transporter [Elizabethkingia meningoseptica]EJK5328469.1 cation transporter [Elizabethkingia meningoseptica]MBG0513512.1 cation transporter [Elizabethkingia meningoseptica]MCL1676778.1 cation diffusion facilitator family transporter [Elizabethkingia meningoseptica]MCL1686617.1 cation diffusion facilitator family transporter [Elizabethkingia meningoseptica]